MRGSLALRMSKSARLPRRSSRATYVKVSAGCCDHNKKVGLPGCCAHGRRPHVHDASMPGGEAALKGKQNIIESRPGDEGTADLLKSIRAGDAEQYSNLIADGVGTFLK